MIHSPIRSPLRSPIRSPLARAIGGGLPGTYYDFTGATLPSPWDTLRRAGLGTRIDAAGAVGYGAHNLLLNSATLSTQTLTTVVGLTYTLSFSGTGSVTLSGGATGTLNGVGASRVSLTFTATTTSVVHTVSGSVLEGQTNAGSTALAYVATTGAQVYLPRPTHNPSTLAALGILVEGQATQLAQSGNLGDAFITQTKTVTAAAHTFSFYGTGSVVLSGVHSATVNGTGANVLTSLTFTPSAGSLTMTVSGTVTDGQLETGTVATSRIPNPGTGTALRTADNTSITNSAGLDTIFGSARTNWTVVVRGRIQNPANQARFFYIGTADYARRVDLYFSGSGSLLMFLADGAKSEQTTIASGLAAVGEIAVAVSCDGTNLRFSVNGGAVVTVASVFGGASMVGTFAIGQAPGPANHINGTVAAVGAFRTALTGSALQALST